MPTLSDWSANKSLGGFLDRQKITSGSECNHPDNRISGRYLFIWQQGAEHQCCNSEDSFSALLMCVKITNTRLKSLYEERIIAKVN